MINAILAVMWEALLVVVARISFKALAERFITRTLVWAGDKLTSMTSNDLDDGVWSDIKKQLTGKRLKVIDDLEDESGDWSE